MDGRRRRVPLSVRVYGVGLRALGVVAPGSADRALARRFGTPLRRRGEPAVGLYDRSWFLAHDGHRLPVWTGGAGPRVLLAHGWDSHAAYWDPLARVLMAAGRQVVAFDMPAHGGATGRRTSVFGMARAIHAVARATGPFAAIVGHSAGGTAAALALREGLEVAGAALLATPALPATFMFPLAEALGLRHERGLSALAALGTVVGRDPFEADTVAAVGALRIPGLVVHDHDDARAPWRDGRAIAEAWRGARLLSTRGLGHSRVASDPRVVAEVARFLSGVGRQAGRRAAV